MGLEEFLKVLARTPRDWRLWGGNIRRGPTTDPDCPLTAVARELSGSSSSPLAERESRPAPLSLSAELVDQIVAACDNLDHADPLLRMELLRASGLLTRHRVSESAFTASAPEEIASSVHRWSGHPSAARINRDQ